MFIHPLTPLTDSGYVLDLHLCSPVTEAGQTRSDLSDLCLFTTDQLTHHLCMEEGRGGERRGVEDRGREGEKGRGGERRGEGRGREGGKGRGGERRGER